mmetsp:Transcript_33485/g.24570  ORF Transcript_33485/g.24570 Transcript_33485/m.24570 type:complete len:107 (-) Transcript_33485:73-393(-)
MEKNLHFPLKNYYNEGSGVTVNSQMNMMDRGTDPKPLVLEFCKPLCVYWKEKLERCESKLQTIIKINPTKTCLYPMRDYVTCVEACVQPKVHNQLVGTERDYKYMA